MKNYKILVKPPFTQAMLTDVSGTLAPARESDNHRIRRENLGNRLEHLTGVKPSWNQRGYHYITELTAEQAQEVSSWEMVRYVIEGK